MPARYFRVSNELSWALRHPIYCGSWIAPARNKPAALEPEGATLFDWKTWATALRGLWKRKPALPQTSPHNLGASRRVSELIPTREVGTPGGTTHVDDNLRKRIKELGEAINQSLSESETIAEAIARIKAEGYEIFLVLDATIGFQRQDEAEAEAEAETDRPAMVAAKGKGAEPKFQVTAQDLKFLKSMRIGLGDS